MNSEIFFRFCILVETVEQTRNAPNNETSYYLRVTSLENMIHIEELISATELLAAYLHHEDKGGGNTR